MPRGLIALVAAMAVGLGAPPPALAADTLAATGDATSITADSADLNGVVYCEKAGAHWRFEYSPSPHFSSGVASSLPGSLRGQLTAVERKVSDLAPATTYYWRVVLVVRSGTRTAQTYGSTATFQTDAAPVPPTTTPTTTSTTTSTDPAPTA
jgi:phosphodiesterase/alkaline phosphatase D-like protein